MKRNSDVSLSVLASVVLAFGVFAHDAMAIPQDDPKAPAQKAPAQKEKVTVVFLGNAKCPLDEKAVDRDKSIEVEGQRVYVCSETCLTTLQEDAAAAKAALAKAYPVATPVAAKACICSKAIEKEKATEVTFQGNKVALCSAACAADFKKSPVAAIAILKYPSATDAKNAVDPIDDKAIDATVVAIYKGHLVHFANWANAATFEKDPDPWMSKLKLSG